MKHPNQLVLLLVALVCAVACSSEKADDPKSTTCSPGKQEACACPGGEQGAQRCKDDGSGWGPCECPDAGAAGGGYGGDGGQAGAPGGASGEGGSAGTLTGGNGGGGAAAGIGGEGGAASGNGGAAGYGANGLDPLLVPGESGGEPCTVSIFENETGCGLGVPCRFVSPSEGVCEELNVMCANETWCPSGHPCTTGFDCALHYVCYEGACRRICEIASGCEDAEVCRDIGHVTHGVCLP